MFYLKNWKLDDEWTSPYLARKSMLEWDPQLLIPIANGICDKNRWTKSNKEG